MFSSDDWIKEFTQHCKREQSDEEIARESFQVRVEYKASIFDQLIAQTRSDLEYFRYRCPETAPLLLTIATHHVDFKIWTKPPYSSKVIITPFDSYIGYTKEIRKNPCTTERRES